MGPVDPLVYTAYDAIGDNTLSDSASAKQPDAAGRLGTEPIGKLLLRFSIPAITGMIVNALYNVVDRIFVGRG
jgi:Na+-driven multidrug efflux pump